MSVKLPDSMIDRKSEFESELESQWGTSRSPVAFIDDIYSEHRLQKSRIRWFWKLSYFVDSLGEARGIGRTPPDWRQKATLKLWLQTIAVWFGATFSLPSMTGFFTGPLLFDLGFRSSMSASLLGTFIGAAVASAGAVMGSRSGIRAMTSARFQFGVWPAKFLALLNCLTLVGWTIVNCVFGGQLLAAVADDKMSVQIGIMIVFVVSLIISIFGMRVMGLVDHVLCVPVFISFLLCYICTAGKWDISTPSQGPPIVTVSNWLNFFQSSIGITSTWIGLGGDYYVDFPESTNPLLIYSVTLGSVWLPTAFVGIIGVGLASTARTLMPWNDAYNNLGGGGLITIAMDKWHGFGKFLVVVMYLTLITNTVFSNYSLSLSMQTTLGKPFTQIPRWVFSVFGACLFYVLSAVGQSQWSTVVSNFLPMIGYWSMIFGVILILEECVFRQFRSTREHDWSRYQEKGYIPRAMPAATVAFCCGIVGAAMGMNQYYYIAPVAKLIGPNGAELGTLLAVGFSALSYLALRPLEIYYLKGWTP